MRATVLSPSMHGRQFVLGPRPVAPGGGWKALELDRGLILSHAPGLPVRRAGTRVLVGIAVETSAERPVPGDAEPGSDTSGWSGRWVLVEGRRLRLDATGTLACAYRRIGDEVWASSSPVLLAELEPASARVHPPIVHGRGMDWYPPPCSAIEGVAFLLPSQALDLEDGTIEQVPLPVPSRALGYDLLLDSLERRLVNAVSGLADVDDDVWVTLTGGSDSRLILAAALSAGVRVRAYTLDNREIDRADRELPPQIAKAAGIEHRFVRAGEIDEQRIELWKRHTGGHAVDLDDEIFAAGQLEHLAGAGVELYGNVLEVGRGYFNAAFPAALASTAEETAALVERELPSACPDGVLAWARWLHETHDPRLHWRERFYIEQRLAGWLGAIGQGIDLTGIPRVHPANCGAYLEETLAIEPSIREAGRHQHDLIARMAPALAQFPVNPASGPIERLRARARREAAALRAQRTPVRYVKHRVRRWKGKRGRG